MLHVSPKPRGIFPIPDSIAKMNSYQDFSQTECTSSWLQLCTEMTSHIFYFLVAQTQSLRTITAASAVILL